MRKLFSEIEREFYLNLDVRAASVNTYRGAIDQFKKWVVFTGRDVNKLARPDIIAYKSYLIGQGKSESTIDLYLVAIRRFYQFAAMNYWIEDIAKGISFHKRNRDHYKDHLTDEEVDTLLASIRTDNLIGKRDYSIVFLMLCTGLRCVEVARLKVSDIHQDRNGIYLMIQRKGDAVKNTRFGVTENIMRPTFDYLSFRGVEDEDEPLYRTMEKRGNRPMSSRAVSDMVKSRMVRAGIYSKSKTPHSLRHTAAVRAIQAKVPIREVQAMLGHSSVDTTEIYLRSIANALTLVNPAVRAIEIKPSEAKETIR